MLISRSYSLYFWLLYYNIQPRWDNLFVSIMGNNKCKMMIVLLLLLLLFVAMGRCDVVVSGLDFGVSGPYSIPSSLFCTL